MTMTAEDMIEILAGVPKGYEVRVRTGPKVIAAPGPAVTRGSASISEAEVQPGPKRVLLKTDPHLAPADAAPADTRPAAQDPGIC